MPASNEWTLHRLGGNLAALISTRPDGLLAVVLDEESDAATLPSFFRRPKALYNVSFYRSEEEWLGTEDRDPQTPLSRTTYTYSALVRTFPGIGAALAEACAKLDNEGSF